MTRRVICGDDVAFVDVWMGGGEQVDHACIWARVRGLRIIWNEMQSLMLMCLVMGELFTACHTFSRFLANDDHAIFLINIPCNRSISKSRANLA